MRLEPLVRTFDAARTAVAANTFTKTRAEREVDGLHVAGSESVKASLDHFEKRAMGPLKAMASKSDKNYEIASVMLHIAAAVRFRWHSGFGFLDYNQSVLGYCTDVFANMPSINFPSSPARAALSWVHDPGHDMILEDEGDQKVDEGTFPDNMLSTSTICHVPSSI